MTTIIFKTSRLNVEFRISTDNLKLKIFGVYIVILILGRHAESLALVLLETVDDVVHHVSKNLEQMMKTHVHNVLAFMVADELLEVLFDLVLEAALHVDDLHSKHEFQNLNMMTFHMKKQIIRKMYRN